MSNLVQLTAFKVEKGIPPGFVGATVVSGANFLLETDAAKLRDQFLSDLAAGKLDWSAEDPAATFRVAQVGTSVDLTTADRDTLVLEAPEKATVNVFMEIDDGLGNLTYARVGLLTLAALKLLTP